MCFNNAATHLNLGFTNKIYFSIVDEVGACEKRKHKQCDQVQEKINCLVVYKFQYFRNSYLLEKYIKNSSNVSG